MSHDTIGRDAPSAEAHALGQVYRSLGALHATLAEADQIDEGLQRRTLDRLMDALELIEAASGASPPKRPKRLPGFSPSSHSHLHDLDLAALRVDLQEYGLVAGDIGTVVFAHADGAAYDVEFVTGDGRTLAVATLTASQVEPVAGEDILHLRKRTAI
jgi:hypothetical protein